MTCKSEEVLRGFDSELSLLWKFDGSLDSIFELNRLESGVCCEIYSLVFYTSSGILILD
jgi:hypothetical protein